MSNKQYLPIVVAIIAVVVLAATIACVTHKDNNGGDDGETYYFYISTDASTSGWHSATGKDAADAFAKAMNDDDIAYEFNEYGYLFKIGDQTGSWYSARYLYNNTSKAAADGSIKYPVNDPYGSYYSSNGWKTVVGYDDSSRSGDKLWEMNGNVFFFSLYDPTTFEHTNPTTDTNWMSTGPFKSTISFNNGDEVYNFYISCGGITGWYSASGKDSADAFANAMKAADLDYKINEYGYLSKIGDYEGFWYSAMYNYGNTSKIAAEASTRYEIKDSYNSMFASNGWITICGYDDSSRAGDKLWEMNGNVFFFSLYDATYAHDSPLTDSRWMVSGPFGDSQFYYFYISTDQFTAGWHTGVGADAAEAFANAMKADDIIYEFGEDGYLTRIGNESGYWYSAMYLYSNTSNDAAVNSILYSVYDSYGSYYSSNGWRTIYGYDDSSRAGDKLWEMNGNVFFFSLYDPETFAHTNPTTDIKWMSTGPFESTMILKGYDEEYYFYISCEEITGWYSATGVDAAEAFANAMDAVGLDYEFRAGYLSKIGDYEGSWYSAMYNYANTTKIAADNSILSPVESGWGYQGSNGWLNIAGYDDSSRSGDKLWEMNGNVFFFSMYDDYWMPSINPTTTIADWSTTGPFAA